MAYSSNLDDESILGMNTAATAPVAAMGLDPDEAALDRAGTMQRLMQNPAQKMTQAYNRVPASMAYRQPSSTQASAPSSAEVAPSGTTRWQDYAAKGAEGALRSASYAEQLAAPSAEEDAAQEQLKTLEQQRAEAATRAAQGPYDPQTGKLLDQYKPGVGTKILRGVADFARGGILGAIAPKELGLTPYNAPNAQYDRDQAMQQAQVGNLDQQINQGSDRFKQMVDARKARATAAKDASGLYRDVATTATGEENSETKNQLADVQQQLADLKKNGKQPETYEQAVLASLTDPDPAKRAQYKQAAQQMAATEVKKFQYRPAGNGGDVLPMRPDGTVDPMVQAIGEGRVAPPARSSKQGQALMRAVTTAYPDYDQTKFPTYQKTREQFTSGPIGVGINSFNTALHHLDALESHMPSNTSIPLFNSVLNAGRHMSGSSALKPYEADAEAVSNEVAKAYKGGAISEGEHDAWNKLLSENDSPSAMKANIAELRNLLRGKLESYRAQWNSAMPKGSVSPLDTINQTAQAPTSASGKGFSFSDHPAVQ